MTEAIDGGALEGVRVLEVGGEIGAWCGKLLADMGATVVKVEPPGGDRTRSYEPFYQDEPGPERSLYFWHYNTSKKSLTLDLDAEAGLDLFRRLVAGADVVLDSHQPGHLADLGIGYEELRKVRPDLVMAAVSPFGQDGPYANYAMTDLTALAFGGPAWSCGYDDHDVPPVRGGGNQGYHTASHFAAIGILIALVHRQQTGVGQFLDVNMHAALNVTTEAGSYTYLVTQENVKRQTGRHASVRQTPPSQILGPGGRYLNVGFPARTEEQWIQLLAWLEDEGVVGDLQEYLSPPSRQALHENTRMGHTVKCQVLYERPFWREAGFSGEAVCTRGPVTVVFDGIVGDCAPALLVFITGRPAQGWSERDPQQRRELVLGSLVEWFGPDAAEPVQVVETDWSAEQWSGGAPVVLFPQGALTRHGPALRAPVGRIHWAGTETAREHTGFMEGALESGERAADEVLAVLRR